MSPPLCIVQLLLPQDECFKGPTETQGHYLWWEILHRGRKAWERGRKSYTTAERSQTSSYSTHISQTPAAEICVTCSKNKGAHPSLASHARDFHCQPASAMANSTQVDTKSSLVHMACRKLSCSNSAVNLSQRVKYARSVAVTSKTQGCFFQRLPVFIAIQKLTIT